MSGICAITMPRWGLTMEEGTVTAWFAEPGQAIDAGVDIVEVESTKLAGTVESPASGVLRAIMAHAGQTVPVGALLGIVADLQVSDEAIAEFARTFTPIEDDGAETQDRTPQTVQVDGATISYLRMGEGAGKVLMIHGFGGDAAGWGIVQQALAADHDVIALNLPGHGSSSKAVASGSLTGQASFVASFLDALGLERVHIVAHSMGGGIALLLALLHPASVCSLTLVAPAGLGPEINAGYLEAFTSANKRRDVEAALRQIFADESMVSRDLAEEVLTYKRIDGVGEALRTFLDAFLDNGAQRHVVRDRLDEIDAPITLLWGDMDRILPPDHANGLDDRIEFIRIPGVGHMPHVEAPAEVIMAAKALIQRSEGTRP